MKKLLLLSVVLLAVIFSTKAQSESSTITPSSIRTASGDTYVLVTDFNEITEGSVLLLRLSSMAMLM